MARTVGRAAAMWIVLAIVSIVLAIGVVVWRLTIIGQRTPTENDPGRQHEMPDARSGSVEGMPERRPHGPGARRRRNRR